jgi:hypothetical protein
MATQAQLREWRTSVDRALDERAGAERYELRQRAIRRGRGGEAGRARPMEFDARGFPIPQPMAGFVERVGRLLNGS